MDRIKKVFGEDPQREELLGELEKLERKIFKLQSFEKNKIELLSWFSDGWENQDAYVITRKNIATYFEEYIEDLSRCIYRDDFEDLLDRKHGLLETIHYLKKDKKKVRLKKSKTKKIKN